VTTIQKLLGHRRLNSTMVYARVHDRTVAKDYYAAMAQIEKSPDIAPEDLGVESGACATRAAQLRGLLQQWRIRD
jgi:hypothetical protein